MTEEKEEENKERKWRSGIGKGKEGGGEGE